MDRYYGSSRNWNIFSRGTSLFSKILVDLILNLILKLEQETLAEFLERSKSSCQKCSVKKGVLKNFVIFIGKHLCWNLFLIKLQA